MKLPIYTYVSVSEIFCFKLKILCFCYSKLYLFICIDCISTYLKWFVVTHSHTHTHTHTHIYATFLWNIRKLFVLPPILLSYKFHPPPLPSPCVISSKILTSHSQHDSSEFLQKKLFFFVNPFNYKYTYKPMLNFRLNKNYFQLNKIWSSRDFLFVA